MPLVKIPVRFINHHDADESLKYLHYNLGKEMQVNTHEIHYRSTDLFLSDDGYIRLSKITLESIQLQHLDSGLYDDEFESSGEQNVVCNILGYTEWVTDTDPAISIGWDWTIDYRYQPPRYKLVGLPFSNIILQDSYSRDLESEVCLNYLTVLISQMDWMQHVSGAITNKYS